MHPVGWAAPVPLISGVLATEPAIPGRRRARPARPAQRVRAIGDLLLGLPSSSCSPPTTSTSPCALRPRPAGRRRRCGRRGRPGGRRGRALPRHGGLSGGGERPAREHWPGTTVLHRPRRREAARPVRDQSRGGGGAARCRRPRRPSPWPSPMHGGAGCRCAGRPAACVRRAGRDGCSRRTRPGRTGPKTRLRRRRRTGRAWCCWRPCSPPPRRWSR